MDINKLTGEVIGAAIEVHRALGSGLLESTYEECLCRELFLIDKDLPVIEDESSVTGVDTTFLKVEHTFNIAT